MKYDVVIIGAGLGGLECAHILSRAGLGVLVLEKGAQPGGCIQSYRRRGLSFDTGFHYVGGLNEGQPLYAAFQRLGLLRLSWQRLDDAFDRVTIGERSFSLMQGYDAFAEKLAEDFPSERAALRKYTGLLRQVCRQPLGIQGSGASSLSPSDGLWEVNAWQYLKETFRDPFILHILSGSSLKMELRRESLPLFSFAHSNGSFIESSWRLKGDGAQIVDSLVKDIHSWGGRVVCNAEVRELEEKGGKLTRAVCADGEKYEGGIFISDVHPAVTCGWVRQSERMRKTYRHRIASLENTFGMFTVSLVIKPQTLEYFNWNQYVYRQPDVWTFYLENAPVGGVLVSCRVPEDGSGYTRQVDLLTPMTWEKCMAWADTKVGRRGDGYKAMKERMADECIELAERFIPGLRGMIAERYTSTPLTYRDYVQAPEGAAYGIRKDCRAPLMTMLSPRTPIPNLFLTGQNLMLHGLYGVTMTSLLTCGMITDINNK